MKLLQFSAIFCFSIALIGCGSKKRISNRYNVIDDFSQLNQTAIKGIYTPESYQELAAIVRSAAQENTKISVAGAQHSQGGHTFYPDGIVISLKKLNAVLEIDPVKKIMTVQAGATWKEIQQKLNKVDLAVKIMQFINMVTVGGALSVNANGIDPHCGPCIESIRSIKIMLADGSIVTASRTEHQELFSLAIGGYGLFGIILEATLDVVENDLYKRESESVLVEEYPEHIKKIVADKSVGFTIGQIMLDPYGKKLFSSIESIYYKKIDITTLSPKKLKRIKKLYTERFVGFKQLGINLLRSTGFAKKHQRAADSAHNGMLVSRNNIMSPPASHVYHNSKTQTDLLQEYFIPLEYFAEFIQKLEAYTRALSVNLMHAHVRFIPKNSESFLTYLTHDSIGIVLFFTQAKTAHDSRTIACWTQLLINAARDAKGTYYLPIQLHAHQQQIHQCYPQLHNFFDLKKVYDPDELFSHHFYKKYSSGR